MCIAQSSLSSSESLSSPGIPFQSHTHESNGMDNGNCHALTWRVLRSHLGSIERPQWSMRS